MTASIRTILLVLTGGIVAGPATTGLQSLSPYKWKKRILLLNTNGVAMTGEQKALFKGETSANTERDLILFEVGQADTGLNSQYDFEPGKFKLILIGKDGGKKQVYTKVTPMEEIYKRIDGMPMRVQEMR